MILIFKKSKVCLNVLIWIKTLIITSTYFKVKLFLSLTFLELIKNKPYKFV